MKILKVALISIFAIIVLAAAAAVIFIKTFDIDRFKPQIISQVNALLNRQVDFEKAKLTVSLSKGISLKINNLNISEDPAFGKDNFISIKEVLLGVDTLRLLFHKEINVPNVLIDSPSIVIIRKKDGSINAQSIAQNNLSEKKESIGANVSTGLAIPALFVSSLQVKNGKVVYIDNFFEPPLQLEINDLSMTLSKFSLNESFPFLIEASVLSSQKNIKAEGKAQVNLKDSEVIISDLKAASDLSQLIIEKIPAAFPMLKGIMLPVSLSGIFNFEAREIPLGLKGLGVFIADALLTNGEMQFKELAMPVEDIAMVVKITDKNITAEKISASIGQGRIKAQGIIEDYLAKQSYVFDASLDNLNLKEIIYQDKIPVKTEGIAATKIKIKGEGFGPEAVKANLSGVVELSVAGAKLKDLNVLRTVLDKISVIPELLEKITANLPDKFKERLNQKDTPFADIKLPINIENNRFRLNNVTLGADEFVFNGNGYAGFDGAFSLEGAFLIPPELSGAMVSSVGQLQYLLNSDKQIYLPLKVIGSAITLKFSVDGEYIAKKMLIEQGTQQLFKVFDKALGLKEEPQPTGGEPAGQGQVPQQEGVEKTKPTTEEKLSGVLQEIFK